MERLYRIANHLFSIQGDLDPDSLLSIPGLSVFEVPSMSAQQGDVLWNVRFCSTFAKTDSVLIHRNQVPRQDSISLLYRYSSGYYFEITDCLGLSLLLFKYEGGHLIEACGNPRSDILRFGLWTAFNLIGLRNNCLLIHSSVVVHNDEAVLCLGESGTGKSTHTRLWLKNIENSFLLNDDSPIVSVEERNVLVYGSPWSGKTHCYHNAGYPVKAFVRLSQAPHNNIRKLSPLEAFVALQPSCPPAFVHDDYYADRLFGIISSLIQNTSIYHLECLPNDEAAMLCHEALYKD